MFIICILGTCTVWIEWNKVTLASLKRKVVRKIHEDTFLVLTFNESDLFGAKFQEARQQRELFCMAVK